METLKLLIVDDHAIFREGLRALLDMEEDFTVIGEASRGDEAVAVADAWRDHRSGSSDEFQVTIWTFVAGGRIHEALALLEEFRARSDEDDNWRQQCEFFCAGATGDHREARRLLERLLRSHAEGRPVLRVESVRARSPRTTT